MPSIVIPKCDNAFQRYDPSQTYQWNYDHVPEPPDDFVQHSTSSAWKLCGVPVYSPVTVAAGPLLNGRWILHYAALGYDVLTYKTVRSRAWPCYPLPNLCPVQPTEVLRPPKRPIRTAQQMHGSWAVSFGMPSQDPEVWRRDVASTRRSLPATKHLAVSVVATPESHWTMEQVAEDYSRCAFWARESGADFVELNFSCPNVASCDGQLYQNPSQARAVARQVRDRIGAAPLLIKIGFVEDQMQIEALVRELSGLADALVMINCIPAVIQDEDGLLFSGQPRGIAGPAIRAAVFQQIEQFRRAVEKLASPLELIAVGGLRDASTIEAILALGAAGAQVATHAMLP